MNSVRIGLDLIINTIKASCVEKRLDYVLIFVEHSRFNSQRN